MSMSAKPLDHDAGVRSLKGGRREDCVARAPDYTASLRKSQGSYKDSCISQLFLGLPREMPCFPLNTRILQQVPDRPQLEHAG